MTHVGNVCWVLYCESWVLAPTIHTPTTTTTITVPEYYTYQYARVQSHATREQHLVTYVGKSVAFLMCVNESGWKFCYETKLSLLVCLEGFF